MGKKLGAVLVGLGVLLLTMGLLSKFYAYSRLAVAPANQNSVTLAIAKDATYFSIADRAEKTGDLLTTVNTVGDVNASKQISEKLGKAVVVWEQMSYSDSPDFNKSSGQAPLSATHSRIAFDANTGEAVQCCGTFVTEGADLDSGTEKRNADVKFEGLLVKFPFNTQKKTYRVWDTTLQKALPVNYKGTQKIHGVTTYKFQGEVPETDAGTVTAPASTFGLPVSGDVTLDRKYSNQTTYWIEPQTGAYVNVEMNPLTTLNYQGSKVATVTDASATYPDRDVKKNAEEYGSKATLLNVVRVWLPVIGISLGLILSIAGVALAAAGRRKEAQ
ncbi:MAG TPA: DUF3068 domain-containing protein [Marmoricola sp.]|nr:DUF3068 domain-containing protein [Marmoricola sp.]